MCHWTHGLKKNCESWLLIHLDGLLGRMAQENLPRAKWWFFHTFWHATRRIWNSQPLNSRSASLIIPQDQLKTFPNTFKISAKCNLNQIRFQKSNKHRLQMTLKHSNTTIQAKNHTPRNIKTYGLLKSNSKTSHWNVIRSSIIRYFF